MANCGQREQETPEALGSATFIWSAGPGAQQETQGRRWGGYKWDAVPGPEPQMR